MGEIGSGTGSSYPASLDTNSTPEVNSPNAGKTKARAEVPNDLAAAVVAIETELGTDPAGTLANVKTFLQTEHGTDGTHDATKVAMLGGTQTVTGDKTFSGTNAFTGTTTIKDSGFSIVDDGDNTKKIAFQASGITTATTRTITMPDKDLTPTDGTFSPTFTGTANVSLAAGYGTGNYYTRLGTIIVGSISVAITPTASTTLTTFRFTLPVASNFTNPADASGTVSVSSTTSKIAGSVGTDTSNDEITVSFYSVNTSIHVVTVTFVYPVM